MLIKNFCENGQVWVCHKNEKRIFKVSPNNIFKENNSYASYDLDNFQVKSDKHEVTLSGIESDAAPVVRKIIAHSRCNEHPKLSLSERRVWKAFYCASCRRTPEFARKLLNLDGFDDVFHLVCEQLLHQTGIDCPDKEVLAREVALRPAKDVVKQNTKARFASGDHPRLKAHVERFSRETGLMISVIRRPNRSFVIGSHGISIVPRGKAIGGWLPIAHDVAVTPTAYADREILLALDNDHDQIIRAVNRASFQSSQFVAAISESLIRSLMNR